MFRTPKPPLYVYDDEPYSYKVHAMKKRRDEIIMACLRGGQHIDDAIAAADRLEPESNIKKEEQEYEKLHEKWRVDKERKETNELKLPRLVPWPF